jgi:hypothetical protein
LIVLAWWSLADCSPINHHGRASSSAYLHVLRAPSFISRTSLLAVLVLGGRWSSLSWAGWSPSPPDYPGLVMLLSGRMIRMPWTESCCGPDENNIRGPDGIFIRPPLLGACQGWEGRIIRPLGGRMIRPRETSRPSFFFSPLLNKTTTTIFILHIVHVLKMHMRTRFFFFFKTYVSLDHLNLLLLATLKPTYGTCIAYE